MNQLFLKLAFSVMWTAHDRFHKKGTKIYGRQCSWSIHVWRWKFWLETMRIEAFTDIDYLSIHIDKIHFKLIHAVNVLCGEIILVKEHTFNCVKNQEKLPAIFRTLHTSSHAQDKKIMSLKIVNGSDLFPFMATKRDHLQDFSCNNIFYKEKPPACWKQ